jgi:sodium-dependent multivitamin transporter 6
MKTVRQTLLVNGLFRCPVVLAYCTMGLIIGTFFIVEPAFASSVGELSQRFFDLPAGEVKTDLMIPVFIRNYLPNGVIGILIIAILSAAMSTLSSAINSLSAASTEDFFNRHQQLSIGQYKRYSKGLALFWGVVCMVVAFFAGNIADTVIEAINKVGSAFYGPILATFVMAIMSKRTTGAGMNAGIIAGVGLNIVFWLFVPELFWMWWNLIGFVVTMLVARMVSVGLSGRSVTTILVDDTAPRTWISRETLILGGAFVLMVLISLVIGSLFQ